MINYLCLDSNTTVPPVDDCDGSRVELGSDACFDVTHTFFLMTKN